MSNDSKWRAVAHDLPRTTLVTADLSVATVIDLTGHDGPA
jgi:hypothetical protein